MPSLGIQLLDQFGKPITGQRNGFALPPVLTTSGLYYGSYKTFLDEKYDEALKHNRDDGLAMKRDCWLMSLLNERIDAVLGLKWSIEVDNPKDPRQKQVADGVTKAIQRTPRLRGFFRQQLQAIWYGRYANQVKWKWQAADIDGKPNRVLTVAKHTPVNGDKIGYQWYDEKQKEYIDTPYVRISSGYGDDALGKADYLYSSYGKAVSLKGSWRDRFLIHTFNPVDADFLEGDMQGGIHGQGIRSVIYWNWWMRDEGWAIIWEQLERIGLGLVIIYYDESSDASLRAADELASNYSRRAVIKIPRPAGTLQSRIASGPNGIEVVEAPTGGIEVVQALRKDLEDKIERFIVGQSMSGGKDQDNGEGLGGKGQSDFAADTKRNITLGDANDLEETQTGSDEEPGLASVITKWSYPWADFPVRFKFHVDEKDPEKVLDAIGKASSMGVTFKEESVRGLIPGQEAPGPDDKVVGGQQQQPGGPGMPGAQPGGGVDGAGLSADAESGDAQAPEGNARGEQDAAAATGGLPADGSGGEGGKPDADADDVGDDESSAFLDFLAGLNGEAAPVQYARDPWEVILYAPEDWVSGTPTRGPNKGKQGWHNTKTKKWLFGEQPGKKAAARTEAAGQKKAAKETARAARQPKGSVGDAVALIEGLRQKPDAEQAKKLGELLGSLRVADLKNLKDHFGIKASGVKAVMAAQIAQRALGDGPPVGGGHPVRPTLAGVAQALGISEQDARAKLGADAAQFEAMLAKLSGKASDGTGADRDRPSIDRGAAVAPAGSARPPVAGNAPPVRAAAKPAAGGQSAPGSGAGQEVAAAQTALPNAYKAVAAHNERLGGIVTVPELHDELRKAVPGLTREQFHGMLQDLASKDHLVLQVNNDPRLDPRANEGIQSPRGLLSYVKLNPEKPLPESAAKPAANPARPAAPRASPVSQPKSPAKPLDDQTLSAVSRAFQDMGGALDASRSADTENWRATASVLAGREVSKEEFAAAIEHLRGEGDLKVIGHTGARKPASAPQAAPAKPSSNPPVGASAADPAQHQQIVADAEKIKSMADGEFKGLLDRVGKLDNAGASAVLDAVKQRARPGATATDKRKQIADYMTARRAATQRATMTPEGQTAITQHAPKVLDVFKQLDGGTNLVSLADLRSELARQGIGERVAQDNAIQHLRRQGVLSLSGVEGRHAVSNPAEHKRQMDAAIREGNEVLGNVAMRK